MHSTFFNAWYKCIVHCVMFIIHITLLLYTIFEIIINNNIVINLILYLHVFNLLLINHICNIIITFVFINCYCAVSSFFRIFLLSNIRLHTKIITKWIIYIGGFQGQLIQEILRDEVERCKSIRDKFEEEARVLLKSTRSLI